MTRIIDWDKVEQFFISGSNIIQTCAALGLHRNTLYERCQKDKNCTLPAYYEEKRDHGNTAIHLAQYQKAIKDRNPTMLIWLGKQRLGQRDSIVESTIPPNQGQIDSEHEIVKLRFEIMQLQELLKQNGIERKAS